MVEKERETDLNQIKYLTSRLVRKIWQLSFGKLSINLITMFSYWTLRSLSLLDVLPLLSLLLYVVVSVLDVVMLPELFALVVVVLKEPTHMNATRMCNKSRLKLSHSIIRLQLFLLLLIVNIYFDCSNFEDE